MNTFLRPIRVHWLAPLTFLLAYGTAELAPAAVAWAYGLPSADPGLANLLKLRGPILIFTAFAYTLCRLVTAHPQYVPGYRRWLRTTPWTSRDPLPFQPVYPVLQDVLLVAALSAVAYWRGATDPPAVWVAALVGYILASLGALLDTGRSRELVAMLFVTPLTLLAWGSMGLELVITAVLFVLAVVGIRRGLERFPWTERKSKFKVSLGWPFEKLGDPGPAPTRPTVHLGTGLLLGWWAYALTHACDMDSLWTREKAVGVAVGVGVAFGMLRLAAYASGYAPPISLWGRLRTGRLVIPGYDVIFVAPLCAIAAAALTASLTSLAGGPTSLIIGVGTLATVIVVSAAGPELRKWRLTGAHRIASGMASAQYARV